MDLLLNNEYLPNIQNEQSYLDKALELDDKVQSFQPIRDKILNNTVIQENKAEKTKKHLEYRFNASKESKKKQLSLKK